MHFYLEPGGSLTGSIRVPGDKSMSHRSIMLGSIAEGRTSVSGFLEGDDALATLTAFLAMGHGLVARHTDQACQAATRL